MIGGTGQQTEFLGKERVFCAIADALGSKVFCGYEKRRVIGAIENPYFQNLLSNQEHQCRVHVLSMQNLNAQVTQYNFFSWMIRFLRT